MEQGFFSLENIVSYGDCESCGLYKTCSSPQMDVCGEGREGILIIGDFPHAKEDNVGEHFLSPGYKFLESVLRKEGISMRDDCWLLSAVNCKPKGNRAPTQKEINCCRVFAINRIKELKPKAVILLGKLPIESVIKHTWKKRLGSVERWVGTSIPDQNLGTWICPTYSPGFVLKEDSPILNKIFQRHIKEALETSCFDFPVPDLSKAHAIYDKDVILSVLEGALIQDYVAYDYETNAKKPEVPGSKIISVSIAYGGLGEAYSFLLDDNDVIEAFKKIMSEKYICKVAHNAKFEQRWTMSKFGIPMRGEIQDTMILAHCEDNRRGYAGLKYQVYTKFGIVYDDEIDDYIKSDETQLNRMEELAVPKLLKYNALDSLFTLWLFEKFIEE